MIKTIGFDFDGTLIMSENKKEDEMVKVFKEKFGIVRGVKSAYKNLSGTGKNREEKVKELFKKFQKRNPSKKELNIIKSHFGKHYEKILQDCPLFRCHNIIKELKGQVDFLFLLSLEDKKEVLKIAKHCKIAKYFDEILGGPTSKIKNLRHLLKKHKIKPNESIYIGDAHSDVIASKKMKLKVILLGKKHVYEKLKEDLEADFIFSSLCDVPFKLDGLKKK